MGSAWLTYFAPNLKCWQLKSWKVICWELHFLSLNRRRRVEKSSPLLYDFTTDSVQSLVTVLIIGKLDRTVGGIISFSKLPALVGVKPQLNPNLWGDSPACGPLKHRTALDFRTSRRLKIVQKCIYESKFTFVLSLHRSPQSSSEPSPE